MSRAWLCTLLLSITMLGLCALWSSRLISLAKLDEVVFRYFTGGEEESWTKQLLNLPTIWPNPQWGQTILDEYYFGFASAAKTPDQFAQMQNHMSARAWYALTTIHAAHGAPKKLSQPFSYMIDKGKKLDPGNALYDLRQAEYYLTNAFDQIYNAKRSSSPGQLIIDSKQGKYTRRYLLKSQQMLQLGAVSYLNACKKELNSYRLDGVNCYLGLLPGPLVAEHYYQRFNPIYAFRLVEMERIIWITQKAAAASLLLARTGHMDLAIRIADSIPRFYGTTLNSTFANIGDVPVMDIRRNADICRQAARMAGDKSLSRKLGVLSDNLTSTFLSSKIPPPPISKLSHRAGQMVLYVLSDEITCSYILLGLAGLWLLSWLRQLGWQRHLRNTASTLPELDWRYILKVPLLISVLGALAWAMLCQLSWMPWRVDAPGPNWSVVSTTVYVLVAVGLPWLAARWRFKSWCQRNGVPVPGRWQEFGWNVGLVLTPAVLELHNGWSNTLFVPEDAMYPIIVVTLIGLAVLVMIQRSKTRNALYFASANRLMQVFWAWSLIAISLSTMPFLLSREVTWLRQDTVGIGSWRNYATATANARHEAQLTQQELQRIFVKSGWKLK